MASPFAFSAFSSGWMSSPFRRLLCLGAILAVLHGCGGGGSAATASPPDVTPPVAPTITAQPQSLTVTEGENATFQVSASGDAPLRYQWRRQGADIAGATSSSYTLTTASLPDDQTVFSVLVDNAQGSVLSAAATLTVRTRPPAQPGPILGGIPQSLTVTEGASATFRVSAVANPGAASNTLAYQWQRNGSDIAGATASSYTVNTAQRSDDQARFAVRVTDSTGSLTSAGAVLTVQPVPTNRLYWVAGYVDIEQLQIPYLPPSLDGAGSFASIKRITGMAVTTDGTAYSTDQCALRKTVPPVALGSLPAGVVTTPAGDLGTCGYVDGPGTTARFGQLTDVALGSGIELFLADPDNRAIRKVSSTGVVSTYAGGPTLDGYTDGVLAQARFNRPSALARDSAGNLYVLDMLGVPLGQSSRQQNIHAGWVVRRISPDGVVSTLPGGTINAPVRAGHLVLDSTNNLYVSVLTYRLDSSKVYTADAAYVLKISPQGVAQVLAGSSAPGSLGAVDGVGTSARFRTPAGLAVDNQGRLLVADEDNYAVRRITPAGEVSTVVGQLGSMLLGDPLDSISIYSLSWPLTLPAKLWRPEGLAIGPYNRLYLSNGIGSYPWLPAQTVPLLMNNTGLFIAEPQ